MTTNIDRPVTLDLSTSGKSDFQTPSQGKFDAHPGQEQSRHPGTRQEQQLQADATRLRELLKAESPSLTAGLSDSTTNQRGQQDVAKQNDTLSEDTGPFKLFRGSEHPHPEGATKHRGLTKDERLDLPHHASPDQEEKSGYRQDNPQARDPSEVVRPFEFFSSVTLPSLEATPHMESAEMTHLEEGLSRMAQTLLVSDHVQGSQTIRMELAAEHYPGVVLEVFKDEGAIVAQFVCANEQSRTSLARAARWLGESLSSRLHRNTLVRVLTDDPEDPSPVETRHHA